MGLVARNPEQAVKTQSSGEVLGAPPNYATGIVYLDSVDSNGEVVHQGQEFDQGELKTWSILDEPGPWALIRTGEPTDACTVDWATAAQVEDAKVRVGDTTFDLPPLDDFANGLKTMPHIPDATARLRFELFGSPVGQILTDVRYVDAKRPSSRVVESWPETSAEEPAHDAPELTVRMSYRNYLAARTGELSFLQGIEDGGDVGETRWTLLLLLHGLVQAQPYVDLYRSLPVMPPELAWWGEAAPFIPSDAAPV